MSDPLVGVVVAHAELADALVAAVRGIMGESAGLVPVSNAGCDRAMLTARLEEALGGRPAVVFTDLAGGSCALTAAALARRRSDVRVVTGVNLAMLLDFAFHRGEAPDQVAARAVETGRAAVAELRR